MENKLIYFFIAAIFFTGCSSSKELKIIRNDVQDDYLKEKYFVEKNSKEGVILITSMSGNDFKERKALARKFILEDIKITENKQTELFKRVNSFKYEDNRYFCFELILPEPLLQEDQKFRFLIKDVTNNNFIDDVYSYHYKWSNNYGSFAYCFVWLIKASKPITKNNFSLENRPVDLIIIFPNGRERHHLILNK
jgi:hypothetical protein